MDLKLIKEEVSTIKEILSTNREQSIELDYVLPDYYPEIHKIIKCIAEPHVVSRNITDLSLSYDIALFVKILYCSEDSSRINVIDQKLIYTKSVELQHQPLNPDIRITARTDYINCRAINSRRVDLRGALSIDIFVNDIFTEQFISDACGMGIQLHKIPVTYPSNRLFSSKQFVIEEEFELGQSNSPVDSIIYADTVVASSDKKIIANKLVAKGEININLLYTDNSSNEGGIESIQFNVPFSQIIDMDGVDENFECQVNTEIITAEIQPHSDGNGTSDRVVCKITMLVKGYAYRISTSELAVDQYSTSYESSSINGDLIINNILKHVNETSTIKTHLEFNGEIPECIYDVRCNLRNCSAFVNECDILSVNGIADYCVLACANDGNPFMFEKSENFTVNIPF